MTRSWEVLKVFWHGELFQEDKLCAHMTTYLYSTVLRYKSWRLRFLYVVFVMHTCRNRFIHYYHANVILYPVLTTHLYFLFWIGLLLSHEVVIDTFSGKIFQIFIDIFSWSYALSTILANLYFL